MTYLSIYVDWSKLSNRHSLFPDGLQLNSSWKIRNIFTSFLIAQIFTYIGSLGYCALVCLGSAKLESAQVLAWPMIGSDIQHSSDYGIGNLVLFRAWRILCVWWGISPTSCTLSFLPQSDFVWRAQRDPLPSGTVRPSAALLCIAKRTLRWDSLTLSPIISSSGPILYVQQTDEIQDIHTSLKAALINTLY